MLANVISALDYFEDAEAGNWPEDGGINSQAKSFRDAFRFFRNEVNRHKAKLGIPVE